MNKNQEKIKILQKLLEKEIGKKVVLVSSTNNKKKLKEGIEEHDFGGAINDIINEYKGSLSDEEMVRILEEEIGLLRNKNTSSNSSFVSNNTSPRKSIKADMFAHNESKKINKKK